MEVTNYKKKLKLLFQKLFKDNFELCSFYSENLLKCLEEYPDKNAEKILDTPFFSDLILYSLKNMKKASISVTIFIMEVVTIVTKNELQFSKLAQLQGFQLMTSKLGNINSVPCTSLYLATIKVATAQITHHTGITWVVQNKIWAKILCPYIHHRAAKVSHAAYNYMSKLVWKLNELNEEAALIEVLQFIIEPIATSQYQRLEVLDAESEKALYEPILPYLNVLLVIISEPDILLQNKVVPLLSKYFMVEVSLHYIFDITRNNEVCRLASDFIFRFTFASLKECVYKKLRKESDLADEITTHYYNLVNLLINKRMVTAMLDFIVRCNIFWAKMDATITPSTFERHGRTFETQFQFLLLLLVPLVSYSYDTNLTNKTDAMKEALDLYHMKLSNLATEHIVKVAYAFRTVLHSGDRKKYTIQTLRHLFKVTGYLNATQAGIVYQALHYLLQMHVQSDGKGALILNENPLKSPDDVKLLSLVLDVIKILLKEHNINWYDSVEIICLQTSLMNLLKQNILPTKQILTLANKLKPIGYFPLKNHEIWQEAQQLLQALDLIDLSIKKFLSPDLALLMESKSGSTLNEIGAVMKSYIQHEEWEVRDSALQLLLSCTEVAFVKYIPLQKLVTDNLLMILAARTALADTEFYVQATALRCLAAATKIESIWRDITIAYPHLYVQLIYILKYNTEGIVRKEVANVLTELYINQKNTKNFIKCMFNVMAAAALEDLHWEVQLVALNFWRQAIRNQLSNRGMIDGKFPSVTFSKEKRKIVFLNDKEIERQLIGMMNDLSSIGCLNVLYRCLNEEDNIDVIEQAYRITQELVKILNHYKFNGVPENNAITYAIDVNNWLGEVEQNTTENLDVPMDLSYVPARVQKREISDLQHQHQVIEDILNTNRSDLILDAFDRCTHIKSAPMEEDNSVIITVPSKDIIHPNIFLKHFKQTDYIYILEVKKKWNSGLSNLDNLLDEVLALDEVTIETINECNE